MTDLQLQVPQQVEHGFRGPFLLSSGRLGGEEHQVEVAVGRHFTASGAAEADDGKLPGVGAQDAFEDEVVGDPHQLVVEEGRGLRSRAAIAGLLGEAARDFPAPGGERPGKNDACLGRQFLA